MSLPLALPVTVALGTDGSPLPGALLYFYESGTTTPKNAYTDAALTTPCSNPLVANAYGVFAATWLTGVGGAYTLKLKDAGLVQRWSVDAVSNAVSDSDVTQTAVTQHQAALTILESQITDGSLLARLAAAETVAGAWNFTGSPTINSETLGYMDVPDNAKTAQYTLALTDRGKSIDITVGGIIIPANASVAFPVGSVVLIYNNSNATQAIQITSDTLRLDGTATTGTRTLAVYGSCALRKVATTVWTATGAVT